MGVPILTIIISWIWGSVLGPLHLWKPRVGHCQNYGPFLALPNVGCHIRTSLPQGAKGISGNLAVPGDDMGVVLNKFQAPCDAFLQTSDSFLPVHTTRFTNI